MPRLYRHVPTRIKQEKSTCWAAVGDVYSELNPNIDHVSFVELIEEGKAAGKLAWNGALKDGDVGVRWFADRLDLQWFNGTDLASNQSIFPRLLTSHVIFMYRHKDWKTSVHTVCVYGTNDNAIAFMDPLIGQWVTTDPKAFDNSWELVLWSRLKIPSLLDKIW